MQFSKIFIWRFGLCLSHSPLHHSPLHHSSPYIPGHCTSKKTCGLHLRPHSAEGGSVWKAFDNKQKSETIGMTNHIWCVQSRARSEMHEHVHVQDTKQKGWKINASFMCCKRAEKQMVFWFVEDNISTCSYASCNWVSILGLGGNREYCDYRSLCIYSLDSVVYYTGLVWFPIQYFSREVSLWIKQWGYHSYLARPTQWLQWF